MKRIPSIRFDHKKGMGMKMDELYEIIEQKIKGSGYLEEINGFEIYEEISDWIEDKENGNYLFLSSKDGNVTFEYQIEVRDEEFNLSFLIIRTSLQVYEIDFDH